MKNKAKATRETLSFYKKRKCWYAEVPEHTEGQNLMVSGADDMCEMLAQGHKRVTIEFVYGDEAIAPTTINPHPIVCLEKVAQSNYGATYDLYTLGDGKGDGLPETCWLCNVAKTVCGGSHPKYIDVVKVMPNDGKPYDGKPIADGKVVL